MSGVNCPECYMGDGDHKMDCSRGRTQDTPFITVTEIKENEDGSATAVIDTSAEGTRFLVELGLISLLEKAIDKENTEYTIENGLHE